MNAQEPTVPSDPLKTDEKHHIWYEDADGIRISVVVPWGFRSGLIPPPSVVFHNHRTPFVYTGSEIV